jgi:NAD(P)-dependent dehydrogenase (short-subunit alcohol dehydrogenase family)
VFDFVLTGSSLVNHKKGIGRACVESLLAQGASTVVVTARNSDLLRDSVAQLNAQHATGSGTARVHGVSADMSTKEGRAAAIDFFR